jgi:hypothetical protein
MRPGAIGDRSSATCQPEWGQGAEAARRGGFPGLDFDSEFGSTRLQGLISFYKNKIKKFYFCIKKFYF